MPRYELRPAVAADVTAVLAFWRLAAEDTDRNDTESALRALLARDPEALVPAVDTHGDGDGIVGSLIAGWDGWRAHLYRFAVHGYVRQTDCARWVKPLPPPPTSPILDLSGSITDIWT